MNDATNSKATETTKMLEQVKAEAEAAQNWRLVWLCDGALAGDVGCAARVRKMTK